MRTTGSFEALCEPLDDVLTALSHTGGDVSILATEEASLVVSVDDRKQDIVVPAGATPEVDLLHDGVTLQVVSFSWFNPDPITADFATEIRLAYERRRGRERPVRGGAVQGNLFEAFRRATFAREVEWIGSHRGPRSIRCEGLAVGAGS